MPSDTPIPASAKHTGVKTPMVIVRLRPPFHARAALRRLGQPRKNFVGTLAVACALRATLQLPPAAVVPLGELARATIFISCGPVPPQAAAQAALALLAELGLSAFAVISLYSREEMFFRELYRGLSAAGAGIYTLDHFNRDMDTAHRQLVKTNAKARRLVRWMKWFTRLLPTPAPEPPHDDETGQ